MSEEFVLEIVRDHMLMKVSGGTALIDTGSPMSIGRGRTLSIDRREWIPSSGNESVLDSASEHLGVPVDWLIGYDVLLEHPMLIDWRGTVRVGNDLPRPVNPIPMQFTLGVPIVEGSFNGHPIRAVLDSGAALSYAPQSAVDGLPQAGDYQDFYPNVGPFSTPTWNAEVEIRERRVSLRAGVLPEMLQLLFGMLLGPEGWIIGSDFFRDRAILVAYRAREISEIIDVSR
jgi:hypothetical protein